MRTKRFDLGKMDHNQRRMLERLSGWRLVGFFIALTINSLVLISLHQTVLVLSLRWQAALVGLASSQSALFALTLGAFRFRIVFKLLALVTNFLFVMWAIRQFTSMGFSNPRMVDCFFAIGTLSIVVCTITSVAGTRSLGGRRFEFRIRDLFVATTAIAFALPAIQMILPNWIRIWGTSPQAIFAGCIEGIILSLWCGVVLFCFIGNLLPIRGSDQPLGWTAKIFLLVSLALTLETAGAAHAASELSLTLNHRLVYLSWLAISLLPIAGLRVGTTWVSTTEFYRQQRKPRQLRRTSKSSPKPEMTFCRPS